MNGWMMPALLTTPSTVPCAATTAPGRASTVGRSVMSATCVESRSPADTSAAVSRSASELRSTAATLESRSRSCRTSSLPIPLPAPVTTQTLPCTRMAAPHLVSRHCARYRHRPGPDTTIGAMRCLERRSRATGGTAGRRLRWTRVTRAGRCLAALVTPTFNRTTHAGLRGPRPRVSRPRLSDLPPRRRSDRPGEPVDALDIARWQFGIVTVYHFLFVPVTIGLSAIVAGFETAWVRTQREKYLRLTKFFGRLFLINIAIGVVTGIVQEFQFGMNWSDYSRFVGDIFGAPLAVEGLLAFFLESTFLGLWIFGWDKLPRGLHATTMWLVHIGTLFSAWFILAANSWMQHPVGYRYNPASGRAELNDFWAVMLNKVQLVT